LFEFATKGSIVKTELGDLPVFPCNADKHPLIKAWQRNASRIEPPVNWPLVGVPTGIAGFDVLDIDPDGLNWLRTATLPTTRVHRTRRGWHFLFKTAEGLRISNDDRIAPGVDVRATGGFAVWWPREGYQVIDAPLAEWPEGLLMLAKSRLCTARETPTYAPWTMEGMEGMGMRVSRNSREGRYARAALSNAFDTLANEWPRVCVAGRWHRQRGRNNMLNKLAFKMGGLVANGWVDGRTVIKVLMLAAGEVGLVREDGSERCLATILSGLNAGMQHPYPELQ
jgi:hypothetical protein